MKCPYCAETIKDDAIVCRLCGRDLTFYKLVKPLINKTESLEAEVAHLRMELEKLSGSRIKADPITQGQRTPLFHLTVLSVLLTIILGVSYWGYHVTPYASRAEALAIIAAIAAPVIFGAWYSFVWRGRHLRSAFLVGLVCAAGSMIALDLYFSVQGRSLPLQQAILNIDPNNSLLYILSIGVLFVLGSSIGSLLQSKRGRTRVPVFAGRLNRWLARRIASFTKWNQEQISKFSSTWGPASLTITAAVITFATRTNTPPP